MMMIRQRTVFQGRAGQLALMVVALAALTARPLIAAELPASIKGTGLSRGVAVVVGEQDEARALARAEWLVHYLPSSGTEQEALRASLAKDGLGSRVVVGEPAGKKLPHSDRFANLVVADLDGAGGPGLAELERITSVRGKLWVKEKGAWRAAARAADDLIGGWTHKFQDATGNCVARDKVAGAPVALRWTHGPVMEDGTADGKTLRIGEGCLVYVEADGAITCRDAGNGTLLWRTKPQTIQYRDELVIAGGRVYAFAAGPETTTERGTERGPLAALDLATGAVVQKYDKGPSVDPAARAKKTMSFPAVAVDGNDVLLAVGERLVLLDRASGAVRWEKTIEGATWFSPVLAGDVVLAAEAVAPAGRYRYDSSDKVRAVVAFQRTDGKQLWRREDVHPDRTVPQGQGPAAVKAGDFGQLAVGEGLLVMFCDSYQFRHGGLVAVHDVKTGAPLWRQEFLPPMGSPLMGTATARAVVRDGEVIIVDGAGVQRYEARTGKLLTTSINRRAIKGVGRGARGDGACSASRATVNWLYCNSWLYVGPDGTPNRVYGSRGGCGQGTIPGNGLAFVGPTGCDCGDYARGYLAYDPVVPGLPIADADRLMTGPGKPGTADAGGWRQFLGNPTRSSATADALTPKLTQRWLVQAAPKIVNDAVTADRQRSERFRGALGAPVVGDGLVIAPALEANALVALDAGTGAPRWTHVTPGRVEAPPSLVDGLAVYGSQDGTVTAVSTADGAIAWRFRAAPNTGVAMWHGHLGSPFPVSGVLALGNQIVAVSGWHTDHAGLLVWVLDAKTGKVQSQRRIGMDTPPVAANSVPVADADGQGFWIGKQIHLDLKLADIKTSKDAKGAPPIFIDRDGAFIRFRTNRGRGGVTHPWGGAMRGGGVAGHRVVTGDTMAFGLSDPDESALGGILGERPCLVAVKSSDPKTQIWSVPVKEFGCSVGALVKAGDRIIVGGGKRDGSEGRVWVISAEDGKIVTKFELPARVTECGLAVANGTVYAALEDGQVVAFGTGR